MINKDIDQIYQTQKNINRLPRLFEFFYFTCAGKYYSAQLITYPSFSMDIASVVNWSE